MYNLGLSGLAVFLAIVFLLPRPRWGLWLIAPSIFLPLQFPTLFGGLGVMGVVTLLCALLAVTFIDARRSGRGFHVGPFSKVMLVAAVPIALSAALGRGVEDRLRLATWLLACITYLGVLNAASGTTTPYRSLLGLATVVTVLVSIDVAFLSHVSMPQTSSDWLALRGSQLLGGKSQANFVVSLSTILLPVPVAYGIVTRRWAIRWLCGVLIATIIGLSLLMQMRAFILIAGASLLAMLFPMLKRRGLIAVISIAAIGLVAYLVTSYVLPGSSAMMRANFERNAQMEGGEPRVEVWRNQIKAAVNSPLFGYGAIGPGESWTRFGVADPHGVFPQAFFEYGLAFLVPLLLLLAMWVQHSVILLKLAVQDTQESAFALATWGMSVALIAHALVTAHLVITYPYSVIVFAVAGLQEAQLLRIRKRSWATSSEEAASEAWQTAD
jgi:hypothetical protein